MKRKLAITLVVMSALLTACSDNASKPAAENSKVPTLASVNSEHIANAANTPEVWLSNGGTYDEQRFSRLENIDQDNVKELGVAWTYDLQTS